MKAYKSCRRCGKDYKDEQLFEANTTFVGVQKFAPYNLFNLELRNCSCGTTLARRISVEANVATVTAAIAC